MHFFHNGFHYCNGVFSSAVKKVLLESWLTAGKQTISQQSFVYCTGCLFVKEQISGLGPIYILELLFGYDAFRPLRSSGTCSVFPGSEPSKVKQHLSVYAPLLWNKLPAHLWCTETNGLFKSELKHCSLLQLSYNFKLVLIKLHFYSSYSLVVYFSFVCFNMMFSLCDYIISLLLWNTLPYVCIVLHK